ncbi:MAG: nucleotidyltransferase domain-containing protein [Clostridia bacterium]|nr:nucleotidyltransferase domain-containing protein [Clostridia bacterium]
MSDKIYSIEEIKKILNNTLKNEPVYKVILFGSYAKKQASKKSDIDLLIDTKSELKGFALIRLICLLKESFQKEIDGFEKYEIIKNSKIDKEIKSTGVVVYEK